MTGPLSRWVDCCWSLANEEPVQAHAVRPDGCIDLLFSPTDGLCIVGAMTFAKLINRPARSLSVGFRFRPGMARAFFRVPANEMTDCVLPAKELLGLKVADAESQLMEASSAEASSAEACMRVMAEALGSPLQAPSGTQRAIETITARHGLVDLDEIANQANLSTRQFRRRCLDESGLTPKQLCRILRFRRALHVANGAPKPSWVDIAAETGYFDQAHLIRDFHEFSGTTPMSVLSKTA